MAEPEQPMHFGLNCRHLKRDDHPPADWRCASAIERYAAPEFSFTETKTPVPLEVAARFLAVSPDDLVCRAKDGEFEWSFPDNIAKRVKICTKAGEREVTANEAAKRLGLSTTELERRIAAGEIKAYYPDQFMHIVLMTKWEYEKCPLLETGGICHLFEPHDGPKIRCIVDATQTASREVEGCGPTPAIDVRR